MKARELSVLAALGASRFQLFRRSFAEVAWIALAGVAAGLLMARGLVGALVASGPDFLPRLTEVRLDAPAFIFAAVVALLALIGVSLLSTMTVIRHDPARGLTSSQPHVTTSPRAQRLRASLVVCEIATSFVLIVAALLLARSLIALLRTDIGVHTEKVVTAFVDLNLGRLGSSALGGREEARLANDLVRQIGFVPGVRDAAIATSLPPMLSRMGIAFTMPNTGPKQYLASLVPVTPAFFRTLGVPLLKGRGFSAGDEAAGAPGVAILSVSTARELFAAGEALQRPLPISRTTPTTVVGIVGDVKYSGLTAAAPLTIYVPYAQRPFRAVHLFVRTDDDQASLAPRLRRAVAAVDARVAVSDTQTLAEVVNVAVALPRLRTTIFASLAVLALLLAAIGLGGVVAYSISQQTRDIGIRMALGASEDDVVWMVVRRAAGLIAFGLAIGIVAAFGTTRMLSTMVYGLTTFDPWSVAIATGTLIAVSAFASYLPARRAADVDPMIALRSE